MRDLARSGRFRILQREEKVLPSSIRFERSFNIMEVNQRRIGIDTWDGPNPSWPGHPVLESLDLLLKIQWRPAERWEILERAYGVRISPWTMFGYRSFPPSYFTWRPQGQRYLYGFSGHIKRRKIPWIRHMQERGMPVHPMQKPREYLRLIRQFRWGVILQGRTMEDCDGKNRREYAYTSCGIPLALNYQPHYPFAMRPGMDYVFLEKPSDLDALTDIDPVPFAQASRRLWKKHFSPSGMASTLLDLLHALDRQPP